MTPQKLDELGGDARQTPWLDSGSENRILGVEDDPLGRVVPRDVTIKRGLEQNFLFASPVFMFFR